MSATKVCTKCGEKKGLKDFASHSNTRDKKRPDCRACHASYHRQSRIKNDRDVYRRYELKRKYGISVDDYNALFNEQNGRCAICDRHVSELLIGRWKVLAVDHDHDTGAIRGLLCHHCNTGLGSFGDSSERLEAAIKYLHQRFQRRN